MIFCLPWIAATAAEPPPVRIARPIHIGETCENRRFPLLTGRFIIHCSATHQPDLLLDLANGEVSEVSTDPAAYQGNYRYNLGHLGGLFSLPNDRHSEPDLVHNATTPPGINGSQVVYGTINQIGVFETGTQRREVFEAHPIPWQAPATAGTWIVWTELHENELTLLSIQNRRGKQKIFARDAHHPVADGPWLAWVEQGEVWRLDTRNQSRERFEADAGFEGPPLLSGDLLCWGDRSTELEVRCSDGWRTAGRRPSGNATNLLVHAETGPVLHLRTSWTLEPGDPLPPLWPGQDVVVQTWLEGAWLDTDFPLSALPHERVRLVPTQPIPAGLP